MTKKDLFAGEQHGFVPGRDCVSQLLMCLEEWTNFSERTKCFDVIYTDFCKAFDSVPHEKEEPNVLMWKALILRGRTF